MPDYAIKYKKKRGKGKVSGPLLVNYSQEEAEKVLEHCKKKNGREYEVRLVVSSGGFYEEEE